MQFPQRDPPPYPGHLRHLAQPGYRQSYSGSEASTDISLSSSENLSTRQDPQGEETDKPVPPPYAGGPEVYSILARLGMPAPSVEVKSTNSGAFYVTGSTTMQSEDNAIEESIQRPGHHAGQAGQWASSTDSLPTVGKLPSPGQHDSGQHRQATRSRQQLGAYVNMNVPAAHVVDVLPPPIYPGMYVNKYEDGLRHHLPERVHLSRSQPDLSHIQEARMVRDINIQGHGPQQSYSGYQDPPDHEAIAARASKMVELLSEENKNLREELDNYYKKVSKLQKFEMEIQKVNECYNALIRSGQKRENLEKSLRKKLEAEIRRLQSVNKQLLNKAETTEAALANKKSLQTDAQSKQELARKDASIGKLLNQNKDLTNSKERLEVELAAQSSTLQEQRKHIDVLDNALTNTQSRLEEECSRSQGYFERVKQLQAALTSLQSSSKNREELEKSLRLKLEKDVDLLKRNLTGQSVDRETQDYFQSQQVIRQKEERILELEAQLADANHKFLEETSLRQLALDAVSMPREARIAALEQSSVESEKIIAEAKFERLHHLDEVYQANKRCAELESKVKSQNAKLAEKDAMIKVLEKHTKLSSSTSSLLSPCHSPRPSVLSSTSSSRPSSRQNSQLEPASPGATAHNKSASSGGEIIERGAKDIKERRTSLQEGISASNGSAKPSKPTESQSDVSQHLWQV